MSLRKNDSRVKMYAECRKILSEAVTFSDEERLANARLRKKAIIAAEEEQTKNACWKAATTKEAVRVSERIRNLYAPDLEEVDAEIKKLEESCG